MKLNTMIIPFFSIFFILSLNLISITPTEWIDTHNEYRRIRVDPLDVVWDTPFAAEVQKGPILIAGTIKRPLLGTIKRP
jgi:hypothetical protein